MYYEKGEVLKQKINCTLMLDDQRRLTGRDVVFDKRFEYPSLSTSVSKLLKFEGALHMLL